MVVVVPGVSWYQIKVFGVLAICRARLIPSLPDPLFSDSLELKTR